MTSIFDCIQRARDAGELTEEKQGEAQYLLAELIERYAATMAREAAEQAAAVDIAEAVRRQSRTRLHAAVAQLQAKRRLADLVHTADDPALALTSMLEMAEGSGYRGESVVSLERALIRTSNGNIAETLKSLRLNLLGQSRDKALLRDVVRELHGQGSGRPEAQALAQAVKQERERLRRMFNAHGGDIGEIENYGLTHAHDPRKLREAGFDAWRDTIYDRLDWHRIIDNSTGKPFAIASGSRPDPNAAEAFLRRVYNNIASESAITMEPSMGAGSRGKALYNQRAEARLLHFKDGDAWWDYNDAFGRMPPFDAMVGQLHGMARDIAQMRVLGPNPRAGLDFAAQVAEQRVKLEQLAAAGDPKRLKAAERRRARVKSRTSRAKAMLDMIDGSVNIPVSEGWANFMSGTRAVLTSVQLGSAMLSSTTDLVTVRTAAAAVGMNPNNVLSRTVRLMTQNQTRENAARMGYIADTLANTGSAAARLNADVIQPEIAQRLAEFTLRASGLNAWTDINRLGFQMEFAGFLADNADKALPDLPEPLRDLLTNRGITAADWDSLRAPDSLFTTDTGETFLSPAYFRHASALGPERADQLATRLQAMIEEELEKAVPTGSVEMRATLQGGTRPGTFLGELARSGLAYKSFALSLTLMQYRRVMAIGSARGRAGYALKFAAGLTLMGAVAVQLKELSKGRDPRPMDTGKFWGAAIAQGGGLGIFGDFFFASENRIGGGLTSTVLGPVGGLANDLSRATAGNLIRAAQGEDVNLGRDIANLQSRYTPVWSSLWYARLAFDRLVSDNILAALDPDADAYWRRAERRLARDYGTESWWQSQAPLPDRSPDLSNALGGLQ